MKIKDGRVSILVGEDGASIEIKDGASRVTFVKLYMSPKEFMAALGRLVYCKADIEVFELDKVGKEIETDTMIFEMPEYSYSNKKEIAEAEALRRCPDGWETNARFDSQDSFFTKDGKEYAKTIIRRWR
jgi:hypothetical protein